MINCVPIRPRIARKLCPRKTCDQAWCELTSRPSLHISEMGLAAQTIWRDAPIPSCGLILACQELFWRNSILNLDFTLYDSSYSQHCWNHPVGPLARWPLPFYRQPRYLCRRRPRTRFHPARLRKQIDARPANPVAMGRPPRYRVIKWSPLTASKQKFIPRRIRR